MRQAGHSVQIFEKSAFAAETGAALLLAPNGARVLSSLGFSFERARARRVHVWETCHGTTLERISCLDFDDAEERFGAFVWAVHRVDLHQELLRLALDGHEAATLRLGARVRKVYPESGNVELDDGSTHSADLVVAADGLHSTMRSMVTGEQATPTGLSAFRFLLPTALVRQNLELSKLLDWKLPGACIIADTRDPVHERHMVWYDCQSGEVQNFSLTNQLLKGDAADVKTAMLQEFAHFHPALVDIIRFVGYLYALVLGTNNGPRLADDVKCWNLFIHDPLPTWVYGKTVLIGDAAHPMLPFGGQGSNQAIEDGGALGYLLNSVNDTSTIEQRLKLFETIRRDRASRVQTLSKVRAGKENEIEQELRKYADGMDSGESMPDTHPPIADVKP
ncbi:MAG: hypothetical protein Q9195_007798 [Heterodermia aff. obscurata]